MAANIDYLDPNLLPLEDKVRAILDAGKALQRAQVAEINEPLQAPSQNNTSQLSQGSPAVGVGQGGSENQPEIARLREDLARLENEIIGLLPTRNEWVKVNLGYGPSRVGAWHVPASEGTPERYELRVVH